MHVIARKRLRRFWEAHPDAETPLRAWYKVAKQAEWTCFADLHAAYAHADTVGRLTVFNIGGNKYRLIVAIHYNRSKVYIRHVLTHKEYDDGDWKDG